MKYIFLLLSYSLFSTVHAQSLGKYVNPFIGTGGHGHTFPGATLPFGMVQLSPDTRIDGSWDGCSGYHYDDTFMYGFSHTHLSGTGVSDYGDVLLMPMAGKPKFEPNIYGSAFKHNQEKAEPGYYAVTLDDDNIQAEFTSSTRVGMHQYHFPKPGLYSVVLDLLHRDELTNFEIKVTSKTRIEGYRQSSAWAKKQELYFVIEFSQPILKTTWAENRTKAGFLFLYKGKNPLQVKVSLSHCNVKGASENLMAEMPHWEFDSMRLNARDLWDIELGKILAKSKDSLELVTFYSALYHCMIHPNVASDINGNYRGMDGNIHQAIGYTHYTVFSLWDTHRALHPLLTIIDQKRTLDFIKTFLAMYAQGGRLPVWELAANETDCMIGYHAASVIADAYLKGITEFDTDLALKAMLDIANENRYGKSDYRKNACISSQNESESVSKTLEYAYDDWCISKFAEKLGKTDIAAQFKHRSHNWYNLFDPVTGFMRPRFNGNWLSPFDPKEVNNHFTEANSWQYSFAVPQDIRGHMDALGGYENFGHKLDQMFGESSETTGRNQSDITGLIGQYAHGNEPSHHIAYLYNYIYMPERTQNLVHSICKDFYTTLPNGLIGNEDCGQMSAWYVMSALGFYQVTPGLPWYTLGTPALDKASIYLENGNTFEIESKDRSITSWFAVPTLNGEVGMFLSHEQLMAGGKLHFQLSPQPDERSLDYLQPPLDHNDFKIPAPPFVDAPRSFRNQTTISIISASADAKIYYYLDQDSLNTHYYAGPFVLSNTASIHAFASKSYGVETMKSPISTAHAFKMRNLWSVNTLSTPNPQYTAGGNDALIDGIRGSSNWRAGDWQGYQSSDFEAVIDLGSMQLVSEVNAGFLQDTRSWILMPVKVEIFLSTDGESFVPVSAVSNSIPANNYEVKTQDLKCSIRNPRKARYVKIKATNFGKLPAWHQGYPFGGDAFIFVDEVEIR